MEKKLKDKIKLFRLVHNTNSLFINKNKKFINWEQKNGEKCNDGIFLGWYKNGKKWVEINYENGEPCGIYYHWNWTKMVKTTINWKNGEGIILNEERIER